VENYNESSPRFKVVNRGEFIDTGADQHEMLMPGRLARHLAMVEEGTVEDSDDVQIAKTAWRLRCEDVANQFFDPRSFVSFLIGHKNVASLFVAACAVHRPETVVPARFFDQRIPLILHRPDNPYMDPGFMGVSAQRDVYKNALESLLREEPDTLALIVAEAGHQFTIALEAAIARTPTALNEGAVLIAVIPPEATLQDLRTLASDAFHMTREHYGDLLVRSVRHRHASGKTPDEIAIELGISKRHANRIIQGGILDPE
jgi:hypothetical protein